MSWTRNIVIVLVLLVGTGVGVRTIATGDAIPLRESFDLFPQQIGGWMGKDRTLDAQILKILGVNAYLTRVYQSPHKPDIDLYIGYYESQQQGATYHSPKNCLPGNGWTMLTAETVPVRVSMDDALEVEVNRVVIGKGLDRQVVYYWYQDRGRVITSEYWAKFYLVWDAIWRRRTDGSLVRVTVPFVGTDATAASEIGKTFVESLFPLLENHFQG